VFFDFWVAGTDDFDFMPPLLERLSQAQNKFFATARYFWGEYFVDNQYLQNIAIILIISIFQFL
jgi:hypothetical protein